MESKTGHVDDEPGCLFFAPAFGAERSAEETRHRSTWPRRRPAASRDVVAAAPTRCRRRAWRRVLAPAPLADDGADNVVAPAPVFDPREAATVAYIKAHADAVDEEAGDADIDPNKGKVLVYFKLAYYSLVCITANSMSSLTRPVSKDGRSRWIIGDILDAFIQLLRHRQGGEQIVRNGRRVLLQCWEDRCWIEWLGARPSTVLTEKDHAEMCALANEYLQHDLVFIPVHHVCHTFVVVLNFGEREYQILDSQEPSRYYGPEYYEQGMSKLRECLGRCMATVGREDVAGWGLREVEGVPKQTDCSSCGLFALKFMQLWDGEKLTQSFSMEDVHAFRTKLAEELVFSELNEMEDVKEEVEWRIR